LTFIGGFDFFLNTSGPIYLFQCTLVSSTSGYITLPNPHNALLRVDLNPNAPYISSVVVTCTDSNSGWTGVSNTFKIDVQCRADTPNFNVDYGAID